MLVALATPKFVWYLMRGSGFVALGLFTLTTLFGVLGISRWENARWPRFLTASLHRNVSLLALCFLAIHVMTALVDQWVGLGFIGAVVPFVSTYRPFWVGLGVLAADLLLAVVATSLLRRHIRYRAWRFVHWGAWLMWPLAVSHALGSGTDTTSGLGLVAVLCCVAAVGLAGVYRVLTATLTRSGPATASIPVPATTSRRGNPTPTRRTGRTDATRAGDRRLVSSSRSR
jgi:predicted ferric reductase